MFCFQASASFDSIVPKMVYVEGGDFTMGSNGGEENEKPYHTVILHSFFIGQYEVTQREWMQVMKTNPSFFKGCEDCPVEEATPEMVDAFIRKLNEITGKRYRLPTEAEWEYAAAGGKQSKNYRYSGSDSLLEVGWVKKNAEAKTHPVGMKKSNELNLFDMSGNVWELCSDWWDAAFYKKSKTENPRNDRKEILRVVRGGSWRSGEERCYNKARNRNIHDHQKQNCGFRLVLDK